MTASERERKWSSILDAAYSSGEQISDWCDKHGLIPHNRFYYWSKKLGYLDFPGRFVATPDAEPFAIGPFGEQRTTARCGIF